MKTVKIKDIAQVEMGLSPKGESYNFDGNGLPLLNGPTEFGTIYPNCTLYTTDSKRESEVNDLIFCVRGSTTGKMNFSDKKYSLGRGVCAIRGKNYIVTKYIKYALDKYLKSLLQFANGGTFPNLCRDDILNFEIPFNNHEKVVKFLSNYDDLIENNNRRIKILEEMAQKIYKEWFVDFKFPRHETTTFKDSPLGKIPNDWEVGIIKDINDVKGGYAFKSKDLKENGKFGIIKIKNIQAGNIDTNMCQYIDEKLAQKASDFKLNAGDILIAMTGAQVGKVGIMPQTKQVYYLNQRVAKFIPNKDFIINNQYLAIYTQTEKFNIQINNIASGAAQPNISASQIENIEILVPKAEIISAFENFINPNLKEAQILKNKNENLKQTRDILLPRLISGEIDVENMEVL